MYESCKLGLPGSLRKSSRKGKNPGTIPYTCPQSRIAVWNELKAWKSSCNQRLWKQLKQQRERQQPQLLPQCLVKQKLSCKVFEECPCLQASPNTDDPHFHPPPIKINSSKNLKLIITSSKIIYWAYNINYYLINLVFVFSNYKRFVDLFKSITFT